MDHYQDINNRSHARNSLLSFKFYDTGPFPCTFARTAWARSKAFSVGPNGALTLADRTAIYGHSYGMLFRITVGCPRSWRFLA